MKKPEIWVALLLLAAATVGLLSGIPPQDLAPRGAVMILALGTVVALRNIIKR
ncbi:hypothetical protein [Kribbella hippodromi]|uniref:hypothetical protein n=1 Tax=Kribbella hippodromi TaxID=434347 RepID=UPI0031E462FE